MKITILECDKPNKNGRIYPKELFEKGVNDSKTVYGKIGMVEGDGVIDLSKISHKVDFIQLEGDILVGELTILDTPEGKILKDMNSMNGVDISNNFRPAGMGNIRRVEEGG